MNNLENGNQQGIEWSWVDFSMGEDVRSESRLLQDETWKNAVADGRVHVSHREYSDLHGAEFINAIDDYKTVNCLLGGYSTRGNILNKLSLEMLRHIVDFALPGQGPLVVAGDAILNLKAAAAVVADALTPTFYNENGEKDTSPTNFNAFRICARCRPLLTYEKTGGAYNSVDTAVKSSEIVIHDGRLARGGRRLTMSHKTFPLDNVWKMNAINEEVCSSEVEPLLARVKEGHSCTLLCFGQTGTGKTYTLVAALAYTLRNLKGNSIEIIFYEIHGKKCYDLLSQRKLVHLRSDENEVVHVRGARSVVYHSSSAVSSNVSSDDGDKNIPHSDIPDDREESEESEQNSEEVENGPTDSEKCSEKSPENVTYETLLQLMQEALLLRSSEVTERNPLSSRSHAVCVIKLLSPSETFLPSNSIPTELNEEVAPENPAAIEQKYYGKLTLVDLAGSERNYETTKMTPVQHRESAEINFTLMALKDCFRAYYAQSLGSKTMLRRENYTPSQMRDKIPGGINSAVSLCINPINDFAPCRAPYRASSLTRVLRECFVGQQVATDKRHYTTIITTLSPTPTDVQHSLNSLDHVILMNPALQSKVHDVIVEVPLLEGFLSGVPITTWTAEQVIFWLSTTNNGRFAQLALPAGLDGNGLMKLNMVSLSALCEGTLRAARQNEEGSAWVVQGASDEDVSATARHNYLGRALWAALRREQQLQRLSDKAI